MVDRIPHNRSEIITMKRPVLGADRRVRPGTGWPRQRRCCVSLLNQLSTEVEPGGAGRREVQFEAGAGGQPLGNRFALVGRVVVRVFCSVQELAAAIKDYLAHHNADAKPFVWSTTVDAILERSASVKSFLGHTTRVENSRRGVIVCRHKSPRVVQVPCQQQVVPPRGSLRDTSHDITDCPP